MKNIVKNFFPIGIFSNGVEKSSVKTFNSRQNHEYEANTCSALNHFIDFFLPISGIYLNPSQKNLVKWLQMFHSFLAFLFTLIIYIILLTIVNGNSQKAATAAYLSNAEDDSGDKPGPNTFVWNVIVVDYGSMAISTVGIYIFAAFKMARFFRKLRNSLDQTENYLSKMMSELEQQHHFSKYRKLSVAGITYILTSVALLSIATVTEMFTEQETPFRIFLEIAALVAFVYPMSLLILFCLVCSLVANQLRTIGKIVRKISNDGMDQLKELQNEHVRIYSSINLINRSFGPLLLLEVSYIFIAATVFFVYVMVASISSRGWTIYFVMFSILLVHFVDLILISFSADQLKNQSRKLRLVLFKTNKDNLVLQRQIRSFAGQVSQLDPQITASGFFSIGKGLIPALMGTTLTYFFISYQFYSAEIGR